MILKLNNIFLVIVLQILFTVALANEECPVGAALVFSNGMFNSTEDAQRSLKELKKNFNYDFNDFQIAYNENEPILLELLQVFDQKKASDEKFLWSHFSRLDGPKWFNNVIKKRVNAVTSNVYIDDRDFQQQLELYKNLISDDSGVFVVAHSQGNFYANAAYDELVKLSETDKPLFRIISIANPDNRVAGDEYGTYFTLESDILIRSILFALPPNISNVNSGIFDHQFIKNYIRGIPSGEKIINFIRNSIIKDFPTVVSNNHKSLLPISKWLQKNDLDTFSSLELYQCLGITLYKFVDRNWFGESCKVRSIEGIKNYAEECYKNEWSKDSDRYAYNCPLPQLTPLAVYGTIESEVILQKFKNCIWQEGQVHKRMSPELISAAIEFLANPK